MKQRRTVGIFGLALLIGASAAVAGLGTAPAEAMVIGMPRVIAPQVAASQIAAPQTASPRPTGSRVAVPRVARVNVWTSGFQAQVDACRGAVNLTARYRTATIGERWNCGGASFPRQGALVRLTGIMAGTYRVGRVVAVLSAYTSTSRNIPRGYGLLFQTCRNNNARSMTFTQLTRVG
jgi:hypothetical protein